MQNRAVRSQSRPLLPRLRAAWRGKRARRAAAVLAAIALLGPVLLVLPLRVIDPPITTVMLQRAFDRWTKSKSPVMPERLIVPLEAVSPDLRRAILASE